MISKFLAITIIKNLNKSSKYSKPIIIITLLCVAICVLVILLSYSIINGFKGEITDKLLSISSDANISPVFQKSNTSSIDIKDTNQSLLKILKAENNIEYYYEYINKEGLIKSKYNDKEIIEGLYFKGVSSNFNRSEFSKFIIKGRKINFDKKDNINELILSNYTANRLGVTIGDKTKIFFFDKNMQPQQYKFIIVGIYETNIEKIDESVAIIDISILKDISKMGITSNIYINDTIIQDKYIKLNAITDNGNGNFVYNWNNTGFTKNSSIIVPAKDSIYTLITSDYIIENDKFISNTIHDTSIIEIKNKNSSNKHLSSNILSRKEINSNIIEYLSNNINFSAIRKNIEGSQKYYYGNFEIKIDNSVKNKDKYLKELEFKLDNNLQITSNKDFNTEFYHWLELIDGNVIIITSLMLLVAIVNILVLLLVLIIERIKMIGILKVLGVNNFDIRKVFSKIGMFIILSGASIGNILFIIIYLAQKKFKIFSLPKENYYLSEVPMNFSIINIIFVNAIVIVISIFTIYIVTYVISNIKISSIIKSNLK